MTQHTQLINLISDINNFLTESSQKASLEKEGKPRLEKARRYFLNDLNNLNLNELIEYYKFWVSYDEYILLKKAEYGNGEYKERFIALKLAKRGNDIYNYRVNKKFIILMEALENYEIETNNSFIKSDILFITLTYSNPFRNLLSCWYNIGNDFNLFMAKLRKIFRNAKTLIRVFEAQLDGTAHIHALIYIGTHIEAFKYIKGESYSYRIRSLTLLEKIKKCWNYGFIDIQVFKEIKAGLKYIFKYIKKTIELNDKSLLSLSLNWLFRKRSFSINYRLIRFLLNNRLDTYKYNSNLKNNGLKVVFVVVGIFSETELGIKNKWYKEFMKLPPKIKELI